MNNKQYFFPLFNLRVGIAMAKHVGVKLPDDLIKVLKLGHTVAVLATFSEKGLPHTTPIQCIYPKGLGKHFDLYQ